VAIVVLAGVLAAACGGGDDDDAGGDDQTEAVEAATGAVRDVSDQGEPVDGGSIAVGLEAETNSWLPGSGNFANSGVSVAYAIYDPLMKRDAEGNVKPYLAESMEPNDDLSEWTLTLRPDIEFHDGTPLNAEALKTIFDDYLTVPEANTLGNLGGATMEVVDDLTVKYVLPEPNSGFPGVLALAPGWPFSPTAAAEAGEDAGSQPVGTGPFTFESWERDSNLVVKKNPNYWQEGMPHLDQITFRPIPDEDTRISSLRSGDVDAIMTLRQGSVIELRDLDGVDNYEQIGNSTGVNIFNTSEPPLDDVRVREALARAIDQQQVIEVLGGEGVVPPATQIFGPDDPYYSQAVADGWVTYDPDAATEVLQEYIDDPERSDGKAAGEPVEFRFDCPPDPSLNEVSQLYQALWGSIGVNVELRQVEQATHVDEAISGEYQAKCFRAGLDGDPAPVLKDAFGEESPLNFTRFTDPDVSEDLSALRATADVPERQQLVEEIMTVVNENFAMTYSGGTLAAVAVQDHVKNVDGWAYPDGSEGGTVTQATVQWGDVWTTE
jgi:peptide/nickel transport system substrate-binding protein